MHIQLIPKEESDFENSPKVRDMRASIIVQTMATVEAMVMRDLRAKVTEEVRKEMHEELVKHVEVLNRNMQENFEKLHLQMDTLRTLVLERTK